MKSFENIEDSALILVNCGNAMRRLDD